jgi:hypothetical protein
MNLKISIIIVLALLASSCSAPVATQPPITLEDVQSTSMAGAFTAMAETHAARPTKTMIPPTETPTQTLVPSNTSENSPTLEPSSTLAPSITPTFTALPTKVPTFTPQPVASPLPATPGSDPCNRPLTSWQGPSTRLMIRYEYKPQGKNDKVVLSLWVRSDLQECGFLPSLSAGPVGQYSAMAYVDGEKDFKVYGGFRLTEGGWEIIIRNDTIVAKGGCYPNC